MLRTLKTLMYLLTSVALLVSFETGAMAAKKSKTLKKTIICIDESIAKANKMFECISDTLNETNGRYLCVTLAEHFIFRTLVTYFTSHETGWTIDVDVILVFIMEAMKSK